MCVGEVAHMHVLVSITSDFLHMRHSMFTFTREDIYGLRGITARQLSTCAFVILCICGVVYCQDRCMEGLTSLAKSPTAKNKMFDKDEQRPEGFDGLRWRLLLLLKGDNSVQAG